MPIEIVCAWCRRDIGTKEGEALCSVSHGICPECAQKVWDELHKRKSQMEEEQKTARISHQEINTCSVFNTI
ncbi:MAG: hypothetical protein EHM85_03330 [Desulfobacteraceae bacterium]|nr:MAG: hypothetical protein EHM85_03330 [Desulfobacteraceae bacterium]